MIRAYINNELLELGDEKIKYTKQVNTIFNLSDRQANFSHSFKVPDTSNNNRILKGLDQHGSLSRIPYRKNNAMLFVGNACIIYNGYAVVEKYSDGYEISFYDGNISFFKALDNLEFKNIDLSDLEHERKFQNILESWANDYNYKYLISDYGVEQPSTSEAINTDFLIPSAKVVYLWNKIFNFLGWEYSGLQFNTDDFLKLYLSFPKGVDVVSGSELAFEYESKPTDDPLFGINGNTILLSDQVNFPDMEFDYFVDNNYGGASVQYYAGGIIYKGEPRRALVWYGGGYYFKAKITGTISVKEGDTSVYNVMILSDEVENYLNAIDVGVNVNPDSHESGQVIVPPYGGWEEDKEIEIEIETGIIQLGFDKFELNGYIHCRGYSQPDNFTTPDFNLNFEVEKVDVTNIEETDFFEDITPKDFVREVMWRFGLTPFTDVENNTVDFLTWKERAEAEIIDISKNFLSISETTYDMSDYGKRNYYTLKYPDDENKGFNDGFFKLYNDNLDERVDVIQSKTFSVRQQSLQNIFDKLNGLPRMDSWTKDVKEDDQGGVEIEYETNKGRYYFLRHNRLEEDTLVYSDEFNDNDTIPVADFADKEGKYNTQRIIDKYYSDVKKILDYAKIKKATFLFSDEEFYMLDLKKVYYIAELDGYYLINKASKNDLLSKETELELIKLNK